MDWEDRLELLGAGMLGTGFTGDLGCSDMHRRDVATILLVACSRAKKLTIFFSDAVL